jgi:hypothetical protein
MSLSGRTLPVLVAYTDKACLFLGLCLYWTGTTLLF